MILISACGGLKFLMFVHNSTVDKPVNSAIGQARPLSELTLFEQQSPYFVSFMIISSSNKI